MDKFTTTDLQQLTSENGGPCVTICMPTHVGSKEGQQDLVRLKNLIRKAEEQLVDGWMRGADAKTFLQSARKLTHDSAFWQNRSEGLALFLTPHNAVQYRVPMRLDELVVVNRKCHVKPLLPLLNRGENYYILSLSQNLVRLIQASRYRAEMLSVPGLPQNMKQALN